MYTQSTNVLLGNDTLIRFLWAHSKMKTGIVGYGCYVPLYRIKVEEIARVWGQDAKAVKNGLLVEEKSVADYDEDTITMSVEAGRSALARAGVEHARIGALFIGSESHPYAVKPSGTVVAEALCATPDVMVADFEFACKAGTAAMQVVNAFVRAGDIEYGMAIGADTAQGRPGDALEFTAASGAAAFVIGKNPSVVIEHSCSFTTDTPDFWRREGEDYPRHGGRFTGEPAYFRHVVACSRMLMKKTGLENRDFDYVVFHMPNGKFPLAAARKLGFEKEKVISSLVVTKIGNTYSASSLLGFCSILDKVGAGKRILLTSFGSGAGSDSFSLLTTDALLKSRNNAPAFDFFLQKKEYIDYGTYVKLRKKLKV